MYYIPRGFITFKQIIYSLQTSNPAYHYNSLHISYYTKKMAAHVKRIAARDYFVANVTDDRVGVFPPYKVTVSQVILV